jgi:hypothetical protein
MTNEATEPNSEEEKIRRLFVPDVETEFDDSPKNDRPTDLANLTDTSVPTEKIRELFVPGAETEFDDSPKNDRPADLEKLADTSKETGTVRKPVEIDQWVEEDDPRSPKNTDRGD